MTVYTPADTFSDVRRYDISDLVQGGASGASSLPIEDLADRTEYINNRLGGYKDIVQVTATGSITAALHANRLVSVVGTANITLTVANVNTFKKGARLCFIAKMTGTGPFWCKIVTGQNMEDGSVTSTGQWLYDGEMIELVADVDNSVWKLVHCKGNFEKVGMDDLKRIQPRNSFIAQGTTGLSRTTYARIWNAISGIAVAEADKSLVRYQAMFGDGNGTTTFSLPDMRSMFWRGLDLSRGIDIDRLDDSAGGYEADELKAHNHNRNTAGNAEHDMRASAPGGFNSMPAGPYHPVNQTVTGNTGGLETRPKNIGLIPIIYY
jgi:hypothetical protein